MAITFACQCGRVMKFRDEYAGSPVKCPGCGATVQVPAASSEGQAVSGATVPTSLTPTATAIARPGDWEPWYYKFLVVFSLIGLVTGTLQFGLTLYGYLGQEGGIGAAISVPEVVTSCALFLSTLMGYAVAMVLVDVGRNVRRLGRTP